MIWKRMSNLSKTYVAGTLNLGMVAIITTDMPNPYTNKK